MFIRCPECGFERELNAAHIPDSAVMATCPQCRHRFRFRDHAVLTDTQETSSAPEAALPRLPGTPVGDDPLPPGAITPARLPATPPQPPQAEHHQSPRAKTAAPVRDSEAEKTAPEASSQPHIHPEEPQPSPAAFDKPEEDRRSLFTGSGNSDISWETETLSRLPMALYYTILQVLFAAPAFFTRVGASRASLLRPGIFYVLLGTLQSVVQHFWLLARLNELASMQDPKLQASLDAVTQNMSLPMLFISMPPVLLILLVLYAGIFNLMIRLVQPDRANFSITLRVVAYSAAPGVLCIVPVVGAYAASIWFAFCCFVGCKHALNIPWKHTAIALLPLYVLAFAFSLHINKMLLSAMH